MNLEVIDNDIRKTVIVLNPLTGAVVYVINTCFGTHIEPVG